MPFNSCRNRKRSADHPVCGIGSNPHHQHHYQRLCWRLLYVSSILPATNITMGCSGRKKRKNMAPSLLKQSTHASHGAYSRTGTGGRVLRALFWCSCDILTYCSSQKNKDSQPCPVSRVSLVFACSSWCCGKCDSCLFVCFDCFIVRKD